jgi:nucleoside-diphosphate kinase
MRLKKEVLKRILIATAATQQVNAAGLDLVVAPQESTTPQLIESEDEALRPSAISIALSLAIVANSGNIMADDKSEEAGAKDETNSGEKDKKMGARTFSMIKPNAFKHKGEIIKMIEGAGFKVVASKETTLLLEKAKEFYEVHKDRPFYEGLCEFMSSGPIVALVLEKKDDAVEDYRKLMGPTKPEEAEEGTIRKKFGEDVQKNAVHGSDSPENAEKEIAFFFPDLTE